MEYAIGNIAVAISWSDYFTALLDGKWIRFTNDKGSTFIYKFDEHCPAGTHELKISVEDCVGNRTERTYHFTR